MRRISIVLSVLVLTAMILAACGGEETSTSIPTQNIPPATTEVTATSEAAETATEAPVEATTTGTPETSGIPVTGESNSDRLSNELKYMVLDQSGKQVGKVDDMVLDLSKARVLYVVVNADGKKIPVPWTFLKVGPASASSYPNEQQMAFTLQADTNTLKNAPVLDPKNVPELGAEPDSWDISFRKYWEAGGASGNNTPAPAGTAVTDTTATATSSSSAGTGLATSTPTTSAGPSLATSTPATSAGTGQGTGIGQGATAIQGVQLASKVIGAKLTVGIERPVLSTPAPSTGGTGAGSATATPTSAGTGLATATPGTSGAGTSLTTATPTSASAATSAPSAGATAKQLNATIDDLIVNTDSGDILYVVVKTNFDNGEHLIPVPLRLLQLNISVPASDTSPAGDNNKSFVLNIDATTLQNAPFFQKDQFPDMTMAGWNSEFESFWQNNGTGSGSGTSSQATATPTP